MARLVHGSAVFRGISQVVMVLCGIFSAASRADEVVRIMAANISSGSDQSYDLGHGNRIFDGLNPDVALVQEMNVGGNNPGDYGPWVTTHFGAGFSYFVETGKSIPNGIVSRYPILEANVWNDPEISDREFVWARIDLPGDMNLLAVSVHFKASSGSTNETRRNNQAAALNGYLAGELEPTDYLVIGGDFNTFSRNPTVEPCLGTLSSRVVIAAPWPADQAGNTNTNESQSSPYDWVMPSPNLAARSTPLVIGTKTHLNGLVFDSRDYTPLSAVAPVRSGDSGATGMQHMAVMRAFLIPTNVPPVITQGTSVGVTLSKNNTPTAFSRSLNASDPDGDPLNWSIVTAAAHGTAGIVAPAAGGAVALNYVPATNYTGTDSFTVRVADGQGGTDAVVVQVVIEAVPAYDSWTFERFAPLSAQDEGTRWGENADPDGDGRVNLEEFAQGLDPSVKDSATNLMSISRENPAPGSARILSYKVRIDGAVAALNYTVMASSNPAAGWAVLPAAEYVAIGDADLGGGFRMRTIRLSGGGSSPARFFRLRFTRLAVP